MNSLVRTGLIAASVSVLALSAHAEITLIANEPGPNRGVRAKAVEYIGQQINERTGGEIRIEQNWGGALFKINAALESMSTGVADIGLIIGAYAQSEFPELAIGDLPVATADPWVMMMAMNELFHTNPRIQERLDELNLVYVAPFGTSQGILGCQDKAIKSADDFKGVKMRYAGAYGEIYSNLDANMVDMSIYDAFQGMETGLLECTLTYPYFAVATKLDDMLDSITPMNFNGSTSLGTFINKLTFETLTPEQQKVVTSLDLDVINFYSEQMFAADANAWAVMRDQKGIPVYELSPEDYARMDKAAEPMITRWKADASAKGFDADALLGEFRTLIDKYNAVVKSEGYPWDRS